MRQLKPQAGDTKLGCIVWLIIMAILTVALWQIVPAKMRSAELYDYITDQARLAQRTSHEQLKKKILKKAKELDIYLRKEDLQVTGGRETISIHCKYVIPIELPGYTYIWEFEHSISEQLYIF